MMSMLAVAVTDADGPSVQDTAVVPVLYAIVTAPVGSATRADELVAVTVA